jgi:Fic family protein
LHKPLGVKSLSNSDWKKRKSVAQRWPEDTIGLVEEYSEKRGVSKTQFTINAIEIYSQVVEMSEFSNLTQAQIISLLTKKLSKNNNGTKFNEMNSRNHDFHKESPQPHGLIIDRVYAFLKENRGKLYSTTELSNVLKIPQSTVRSYIRKLEVIYPGCLQIYAGRPNKIECICI